MNEKEQMKLDMVKNLALLLIEEQPLKENPFIGLQALAHRGFADGFPLCRASRRGDCGIFFC